MADAEYVQVDDTTIKGLSNRMRFPEMQARKEINTGEEERHLDGVSHLRRRPEMHAGQRRGAPRLRLAALAKPGQPPGSPGRDLPTTTTTNPHTHTPPPPAAAMEARSEQAQP